MIRTFTKWFGYFPHILQIKEIFISRMCIYLQSLNFFPLSLRKFKFMDELSVLSISLSIASLGIFFLFFASNDDDDQDGGKLIKSVQRIN